MGSFSGRRHAALLMLVLLVEASGVTPSSRVRRYLKRKMPQQYPGLKRHRMLQQVSLFPMSTVMESATRAVSIDLVGEYLREIVPSNASVHTLVIEQTHDAYGGRERHLKRARAYQGKGESKTRGEISKHGYVGPFATLPSKGRKSGNGGTERSKWSKKGKGSGGKTSKSKHIRSKGSGGKGVSRSKNVGAKSSKSLSKICMNLDFGEFYYGGYYNQYSNSKQKGSGGYYLVSKGNAGEAGHLISKGKAGESGHSVNEGKAGRAGHSISKGKAWKARHLKRHRLDETHDGRSLQFEGELCSPNIFDVASMDPELSIFVELVEAANLQDIFLCTGPFTVLAPSNAAFYENPSLLKTLFNPKNSKALQEILLYHIAPGLFMSEDLVSGPLQTLLGEEVDVTLNPLKFNQAEAIETDILACNGVMNIIDDLLIPPDSPILPEICEVLDFRTGEQFPVLTRMSSVFQGAYERTIENDAPIAIDGHRKLQFEGERCNSNIFDVASENPLLTTFVELLDAANLEDLFLCAGPFTLAAPTNEAFQNLDSDLLQVLLLPENREYLQEILLYHIIPGYLPSNEFQQGPYETLFFGFDVDVLLDPLRFNNASAIRPDTLACNGVIHIIDDVLLPPEPDICDAFTFSEMRRLQEGGEDCNPNVLETVRDDPDFSTIVSLIDAAGDELESIFNCAGPFTANLPVNEAFDALDPAYLEFLLDPANIDDLQDLLLYHILPGATLSEEFTSGPAKTLLPGQTVDVGVAPLTFNDANVMTADIPACNGIINKIDMVLLPFPVPAPTPATPATPLPTPVDICEAFTFDRRTRKLQDGGRNCDNNVIETAAQNPDLQIVTMLINVAGLEPIFSCAGPFTALLPTNDAFNNLDPAFLDNLLLPENMEELRNFLLHHILPGATLTNEFTEGTIDTLFAGSQIDVGVDPIRFDQANVITPDIQACNGVIDVIDTVLNPVQDAVCDDFTFGRRVRRLQDEGENCNDNVLQSALQNPDLEIFTSLVESAGLEPIFECAGPFTALLPTNDAFADVDPAFLQELLLPENIEDLRNFVLYHVLPGATLTTEFSAGPTDTLFTDNQVGVGVDPIQFDRANVLEADTVACNGYINVLDTVLNPFEGPAPTSPVQPTSSPTGAPIIGTIAPVVTTASPTTAPVIGTVAPVVATSNPTAAPSVETEAPVVASDAPSVTPTLALSVAPTLAPSFSPLAEGATRAPVVEPRQVVRVTDYYMSYETESDREPTEEEYNEMLNRTTQYFNMFFEEFYATNTDVEFLGLESSIGFTLYGAEAGIPEPQYDIYIDFEFADLSYTEDSTPPTAGQTFTIMQDAITEDYILNYVRTFEGSPFETCTSVTFAASERIVPQPDEGSYSPLATPTTTMP